MFLRTVEGRVSKIAKQPPQAETTTTRAGWAVKAWCEAAGISDALLYKLEEGVRPASVKVRRRRLIIESPRDWLRRMGQASGAKAA
jgi:hypothetical protein